MSDISGALQYLLLKSDKKRQDIMTNKELLQKMKITRDKFINEYEQYTLTIDERLPYLDMIIKLNEEIRTIEISYTDLYR